MKEMRIDKGACRFCGQMQVISIPKEHDLPQSDIDDMATQKCDCNAAEEERKLRNIIDAGKENIGRILADRGRTTTAQIMMAGVDAVGRGQIKKISINVDGETTCSMYMKGRDVVVEARRTEVETSEVG